ncbi:MAG: flippase [Bulleidia sp.]|nr:flippase [Bulleidia sp.]
MHKGSFRKNTAWLLALQIYSMILSFLTGPLTARALGPELYGSLGYAESIVVIYTTIAALGMDSYIVAELLTGEKKQGKTLGTALILRLFLGAVCAFLAIGTAWLLRPDNKTVFFCTLLESTMIILQVYAVFNYWFQSNLLSKYFTLASVIALTITALWKLWLYLNDRNAYLFALAQPVRYFIILIILIIAFRRLNPHMKFSFDKELASYFIKRGFQFLLAGIGTLIYTRIDRLMVGSLIDDTSLGYYNVAVTLCALWEVIPSAIIESANPVILEHKKKSEKEYLQYYQVLLLGLTLFCSLVCLIAMPLAKPVITLLYGDAYLPSVPMFIIIMWSTVFSELGAARTIWVVAEKHEKQYKYFAYIGAVTDILLNLLLMKYLGAVGAALATLATEIVVFFLSPYLFKETRISNSLYFSSFKQLPLLKQIIVRNLHIFMETKVKRKKK